jgi:hypothetical protein
MHSGRYLIVAQAVSTRAHRFPLAVLQVVQKYVQQVQASTRPSQKQQRLEEPSRKVRLTLMGLEAVRAGFAEVA